MDIKRMTVFFAVSLLILLGWEKIFPTPQPAVSDIDAFEKEQIKKIPSRMTEDFLNPPTISELSRELLRDRKSA